MTAVEDKPGASYAGPVLLGLLALVLAVAAAYLWLSDAAPPRPMLSTPPPLAVQRAPQAVAVRPRPARMVRAPTFGAPAPSAVPTQLTRAPGPAPAPDSQIAADAAAVGMTSRVRPAEPDGPPAR